MPDHTATVSEWKRLLRECEGTGISPKSAQNAAYPSDTTIANIADLAGIPELYERSFRRGMVLCAVGETDLTAALFWRGHIFGLYRHNVSARGVEGVLMDLKEFRLGWMPDEAVRKTGGSGTAFAELPAEAEGFPVLCLTGPEAELFAGHGKIYDKHQ